MKKLILLSVLAAATAQGQGYNSSGWHMYGRTVGTNTAYAVVPRNMRVQGLNFFCDNQAATLKLLYPKTSYIISNSFVAGAAASTNIGCNAAVGSMLRGEKIILWSSTNNSYQVATVLSNAANSVYISNETYAAHATNINTLHATVDRLYSCTEYTVANVETNWGGQAAQVLWTGLNQKTPDSMPMAYHMYLVPNASLTSIWVNAWGDRY